MKVSYFPKKLTNKKTTLILGGFETIHNGHLKLIKKAKTFKLPISMMIIEDSNKLHVQNNPYFSTLEIRLQQLSNLGIEFVTVVKMNTDIVNMKGLDFLNQIKLLVNAQQVIVGKDFVMGYNKDLLAKDIPNVAIVEHEKINGKKISTSLLKEFLPIGEVDLINELSPNPFTMSFRINTKGKGNPSVPIDLHPGIYAIYAIYDDIKYYGLMKVDLKKVFHFELPNLLLKNTNFDAIVEIHKLTRKIIRDTQEQITEEDWNSVEKWLDTHRK